MKTTFLLFAVIVLLPLYCALGQGRIDVIHLKNGNVVKGTIIENAINDSVRIELLGGSVSTVKYSEILKITKDKLSSSEPIAPQQSNTTSSLPQPTDQQKMMYYESNKKDPLIGSAMSILLTSSGHAYAGNWARGLIFTAVRAGGVVLALAAGFEKKDHGYDYDFYDSYSDNSYTRHYTDMREEMNALFYVGIGLSVVAGIWEAIDASSQVDEYNQNLQRNFLGKRLYNFNIVPSKDGARLQFSYSF